jgi:hypothetical protein
MSIAAEIATKIVAKIIAAIFPTNEFARRRRVRSFDSATQQENGSRAGGKPL